FHRPHERRWLLDAEVERLGATVASALGQPAREGLCGAADTRPVSDWRNRARADARTRTGDPFITSFSGCSDVASVEPHFGTRDPQMISDLRSSGRGSGRGLIRSRIGQLRAMRWLPPCRPWL